MSVVSASAHHRALSHAEYHLEMEHDSNTSLRLFEESPARYYHTRITKRIPPKVETDAMRLGTATHIAILEPERIGELLAVIPDDVLSKSGSRVGKAWDEWTAENAHLCQVKASEFTALQWVSESVLGNRTVRQHLERCALKEYSIFWASDDGWQTKCKLDGGNPLDLELLDVKRTSRPESEFWRNIQGMRYHCQGALYSDGFRAHFGSEPQYYFLIIDNEPPYECRIRRLPPEALAIGRAENRDTLERLYACKRGEAAWITEGFDEVRDVYLPPFAIARREEPPVEQTHARSEY